MKIGLGDRWSTGHALRRAGHPLMERNQPFPTRKLSKVTHDRMLENFTGRIPERRLREYEVYLCNLTHDITNSASVTFQLLNVKDPLVDNFFEQFRTLTTSIKNALKYEQSTDKARHDALLIERKGYLAEAILKNEGDLVCSNYQKIIQQVPKPLTYVELKALLNDVNDTLTKLLIYIEKNKKAFIKKFIADVKHIQVEFINDLENLSFLRNPLDNFLELNDFIFYRGERKKVKLNDVLRKYTHCLKHSPKEDLTVMINPVFFHMNVMRNIYANAKRAANDKDPEISVYKARHGSTNGVMICIRDQGCGISESVRDRILVERGATTKEGEGHGIGLDSALHVVDHSRGKIGFITKKATEGSLVVRLLKLDEYIIEGDYQTPNLNPSGTEFRIWLPTSEYYNYSYYHGTSILTGL